MMRLAIILELSGIILATFFIGLLQVRAISNFIESILKILIKQLPRSSSLSRFSSVLPHVFKFLRINTRDIFINPIRLICDAILLFTPSFNIASTKQKNTNKPRMSVRFYKGIVLLFMKRKSIALSVVFLDKDIIRTRILIIKNRVIIIWQNFILIFLSLIFILTYILFIPPKYLREMFERQSSIAKTISILFIIIGALATIAGLSLELASL